MCSLVAKIAMPQPSFPRVCSASEVVRCPDPLILLSCTPNVADRQSFLACGTLATAALSGFAGGDWVHSQLVEMWAALAAHRAAAEHVMLSKPILHFHHAAHDC